MPDAGPLGLYIHVPFCAAICSYCNFNRGLFDESLKRRYVAALTREIERRGDGSHVDSIFFGGGHPVAARGRGSVARAGGLPGGIRRRSRRGRRRWR